MKIDRIVKALEKEGWEVKKTDLNEYRKNIGLYDGPRWQWSCENGKNKCDWFRNGPDSDETCSVQVMGIKERNDVMTDYFPGIWCHTIKSIIQMMKI